MTKAKKPLGKNVMTEHYAIEGVPVTEKVFRGMELYAKNQYEQGKKDQALYYEKLLKDLEEKVRSEMWSNTEAIAYAKAQRKDAGKQILEEVLKNAEMMLCDGWRERCDSCSLYPDYCDAYRHYLWLEKKLKELSE